jgi:hypothetical protein
MPTKHQPAELSFLWTASPDPAYALDLQVTETHHRVRTADRVVVTRYRVEDCGHGVYLFAKAEDHEGDRGDEVYECWVGPNGSHSCTCKGSACRGHGIRCRHTSALDSLLNTDQTPEEAAAAEAAGILDAGGPLPPLSLSYGLDPEEYERRWRLKAALEAEMAARRELAWLEPTPTPF